MLDLTTDEILVFEPELRLVHCPYSDKPSDGISIPCYSFVELYAEKIRALGERLRPRDLYDVINLYQRNDFHPDRSSIRQALSKKCSFKGMPVITFSSIEKSPFRLELIQEWENMLGHQLPVLPPFEHFWQKLPTMFQWLNEEIEREILPAAVIQGENIDESWRPPTMSIPWNTKTPLEIIRYAGANHLCIDLAYCGNHRIIEPYSLRRTRDGFILLFAVRRDSGVLRSYRADRIEEVRVTQTPFTPRFAIEFSSSGPGKLGVRT